MARTLWLMIGLSALALGMVGTVLPLLPTVPFLLVAVFAFARSSERLHTWLTTHPRFGPTLDDWHRYGRIDRRAKRAAVVAIAITLAVSFAISHLHGLAGWVLAIQFIVLASVTAFIVTRPEGSGPGSRSGSEMDGAGD
ncbi:MAG: YbaN family protein [Gammaproteobacteria bacterium]